MRTLLLLLASASLSLANLGNAQDFNHWTTETLKLIFIPPTRITRVHGKIKTVIFLFPVDARGSTVNALQCIDLIFVFLFGPKEESNPHMHHLETGPWISGTISDKDPETGYVVTRDRDPHDIEDMVNPKDGWRYYFRVTKNDALVLRAILIEPEQETLGPRFVLHIKD